MRATVPEHIAIIMDGNGRWAQSRGLPRTIGHRHGADAVKRTVKAAAELGISYLTLFGFSSENWQRPADEVNELMRLLRLYLRGETADLHRNNIRLKVIGEREHFSKEIIKLIENAESLTAENTGITVNFALNYGGRNELVHAAAAYAQKCANEGIVPDAAHAEEFFPDFLMTKNIPDPDIVIRTSGEQRISNFLLWQCAYSEFIFMESYWPDFGEKDLRDAMEEFNKRERRFGKLETESKRGDV